MGLRVNQCCCGCSLQTGTKIIGWLYLVSEIVAIVMLVLVKVFPEEETSQTTISENGNLDKISVIEVLVNIVISVIKIVVTLPLLIATYKNSRPMLLLPWLIFAIISATMAIGTGITSLYNSSDKETVVNDIIANTLVNFLGSALTVYYWLVVYSFYQLLRETQS